MNTEGPLTPLRFDPILKRLIWGGRRLGDLLHKPIGPESDYAESWELSDHRHGRSVVRGGPLDGSTLHDLVVGRGPELLGPGLAPRDQFPLLVKFIDANRVLSVQVHPDDAQGRRLADDNGKNESWVVIAADPGSRIYAGLKEGVTRPRFAEALGSGRVEEFLHSFEPTPGDCIHIPAGTVHAIGAGVMLAEVQQMSDATFRVFDWGRLGPDGRPRQLHVAEALEVTDFSGGPVDPVRTRPEPMEGGTLEHLVRCPYFLLDRLRVTGPASVGAADRSRFTALVGLGGSASVSYGGESYPVGLGETLLLPASIGSCTMTAEAGEATVLACTLP
ncbi:type I phosphomannose isomerase catalytic subunit [Tautonia plasticadhaerens]|uniref:Putative mannose-6-phosphate isomerase GmuF n=1 Tax=Tautonia plasticadhaerens TaxID=2527974 RepID=A0A518H0E9_9BACT|nr:type I phosphomannose isomerase catalytic subunit [Tautonia plasticadhaerens]QDV34316.1 putative mannose-6-phosphate isomerase GmuF [Tautonia plasticadhaerens]